MKGFLMLVPLAVLCVSCGSTSGAKSDDKKITKEKVVGAAKKAVEASKDAVVTGDWELKLITGGEKGDSTAKATMTVTDEGNNRYALQGFTGVNTFSGSLTIGEKGAITVDQNVAATRVGGSPDQMAAEQTFLDALKGATSWKAVRVGVETLEMKGSDAVLAFVRLTIADRVWNLSSQADEKRAALVSVLDGGRKVTLMIARGKANIFTGLNITNIDCTLDEEAHTLQMDAASGAMTLASGSDEEMEQERLYLNNLNAAASYTISGNTLSVQNDRGHTVLVFEAQELL